MSTDDTPYQKPIHSEIQTHKSDHEQQDASPALGAEPQIPPAVTKEHKTGQKQKHCLEWLKFGIDILTLIAVAAYAIIAYYQWGAMYKATEVTKKSADAASDAVKIANDTFQVQKESVGKTLLEMNKQTKAMQVAADAAKKGAKTAQDTLLITQRPFVFVAFFETHVIGKEMIILPKWENSGSTPAMQHKNWTSWKAFPNGPPNGFTWPDLDTFGNPLPIPGNGITTFIGPKATKYAEPMKIPVATMERVRLGDLRLFLWGWCEYNDILGGTPKHRTEFCNEVTVTDLGKDAKGEVTIAVGFANYGPYNTAN